MSFAPAYTAFAGFRLARRRPLTLVALTVLGLLSSLGTLWFLQASGYGAAAVQMQSGASPEAAVGLMGAMFRFVLGLGVVMLVVNGVQSAAIYRGVLRPQEHGLAGLSLGASEWRLALLALIMGVLGFILMMVVGVVLSILLVVVGLGPHVIPGTPPDPAAVMPFLVPFYAGLVLIISLPGTKLSFAGPATFERKELVVFRSWEMTKGSFRPLWLCYLLMAVLSALLWVMGCAIAVLAAAALTGQAPQAVLTSIFSPGMESVANPFAPERLVYTAVFGLLSGLFAMVWTAPSAEAYRELSGQDASAEAFT